MAKQLITRILLRRDTNTNWETNKPILSKGEIALSYDNDPQGVAIESTYRLKIGDGTTAWDALPFYSQTILNGTGAPAAANGENNQFYVDTTNKYLYYKTGGVWTQIGGDISNKLDKNTTRTYSVYGVAGAGDQVLYPIQGAHNGIAGLDSNNKIPASLLPDYLLGSVIYGGVIDYFNAVDSAAISITSNLKSKLNITDNEIYAANQADDDLTTTPKTYGYKTLAGVYFIASEDGTFSGDDYMQGDWLISTGESWAQIKNIDAVRSVNGEIGDVVFTGTDGAKVSGTQITAQLSSYVKDTNTATAITAGVLSSVKLDKVGNLSVVAPQTTVSNGTNITITKTESVTGTDYLIKTVDNPSFARVGIQYNGAIDFINTHLQLPENTTGGGTVYLPSSGTLATTDQLSGKQDALTAGTNIEISGTTISVADSPRFSSVYANSLIRVHATGDKQNIDLYNGELSLTNASGNQLKLSQAGVTRSIGQESGTILFPSVSKSETFALVSDLTGKQDKLTAGKNITITDGTIATTSTIEADVLKAKSNNGGELKETILDTDFVILDGGTSTTTFS